MDYLQAMDSWNNVACEIVRLIYNEVLNTCEGRAGRRSSTWMVMLRVCQNWRAVGLWYPRLWIHTPSVVPKSLEEAFLYHCEKFPKDVREMWISKRDEYSPMSKGVASKVSIVHIQMWRNPDRSHGVYASAPTTNLLPNLDHVAFHAGPPVKHTEQARNLRYARELYHLPIFRKVESVTNGVKTEGWEIHRIKSSSFTFDAGRTERMVHYPCMIIWWLAQKCYEDMERIVIKNMGPSGALTGRDDELVFPILTMRKVNCIEFSNCSRAALNSFMLRTDFPALQQTHWNGSPYEIRVENALLIFRPLT
ncbi:hypothetical protein SISSUDRAFT_1067875 [Sistotremastrum suecicum HHB10207 ss-3]|uniref:F-box domain-containing protein n=1 Tax=Sistotremastrum suecicum HHB10207 ss-3 TaxID=1314776 RepID=A0A165WLM0_9AGAM|nr:hypothetical protein SISSUDRAFT_1067875 [Sistotremastrum suecicum HHB10207 ss-3]